jgi:cysteine-rich repeat protein
MRRLFLLLPLLVATSGPAWGLVCGDGILDPLEQCDDGNATSGDGCSSLCLFEGCPATGTWTATVLVDLYTLSARENADGTLVGVAYPLGSPALRLPLTGRRTGAHVELRIGSLRFDGAMSDCNTAHLTGLAALTSLTLTRVRSTYCGDGTIDTGFEACDDGNFKNDDACTVACTANGPRCGDASVDPGEECDDGNDSNLDGCLNGCVAATCGDGYVRVGVEACDDGNAIAGDGCAPDCTLEDESIGGLVGGLVTSITTDGEGGGDGATPSDPVETTLSVAAGTLSGALAIDEHAATPAAVPGMSFFGGVVHLTATDVTPPPTPATPLRIAFRLDASQLPVGQDESSIILRKDGVPVPLCTGPAGEAIPDACVTLRERLDDGDVRLTVLTTTLSDWDFGASVCGHEPVLGCWSADPKKAKLKLKQAGGRNQLAWTWKVELLTPTKPYGDPVDDTDYVLCGYDASGAIFQLVSPAGGTCGDKPCWTQTLTGFKYKDPEGTPDGIVKLGLRSGHIPRAKITTRALGSVALPAMPLDLPVHVQLRSENGPCFEANFSAPALNDMLIFRAVGD